MGYCCNQYLFGLTWHVRMFTKVLFTYQLKELSFVSNNSRQINAIYICGKHVKICILKHLSFSALSNSSLFLYE